MHFLTILCTQNAVPNVSLLYVSETIEE